MAVNIDYGLGARQAAIGGWVDAEKGRANAEAEAEARKRKRARQQRKGLMTAALHGAAAVATGGASIPYSMKYGGMANKALMGDDYEGSTMQSVQGLGSLVYAGAEQAKSKQLSTMEKMHNGQLDSVYKAIDALPPSQVMERARLADQAAGMQMQFMKDFKAAEAKPIWDFGGSEREKQILKTTGKGVREDVMVDQSEFKVDTNKGPSEQDAWDSGGYFSPTVSDHAQTPSLGRAEEVRSSAPMMPSGVSHDWTKPKEEPKLLEHPSFKPEDMQARQSGQSMMNFKRKPWEAQYSEGDLWMQ